MQHFLDHLGIQCAGRFVKEHGLGAHGQCPGDRRPLLLTAGELGRHFVRLIGDTYPLQQPHRFRPRFFFVPFQHIHRREGHIVQDTHMRKQIEGLKHHAHL